MATKPVAPEATPGPQEAASGESPAQEETTKSPRRGPHGRKPLPEDLPRVRVEHDVEPEQKVCAECGSEKVRIGEDVSHQYDFVPASLHVVEHVCFKYACPRCQGQVTQAEKPAQPIEKGLAGPGLLAAVIVSKYADHLPLHRQESILARHGVEFARSTLCDWTMQSAELLAPVVAEMRRRIVSGAIVQSDDTHVPVLEPAKRQSRRDREAAGIEVACGARAETIGAQRAGPDCQGSAPVQLAAATGEIPKSDRAVGKAAGRPIHNAYLWVYLGDADHPYTVYDFTWGRGGQGPETFLEKFEGYLQADAYAGYDGVYAKRPIVEVGCMAHLRRYFFEAKGSDPVRAHDAMRRIRELYAVEKLAKKKEMKPDERRELRRQQARPVLDEFLAWLKQTQLAVLPKSPMGKAIGYALNNETALRRYIDVGQLAIDNNASERALRRVVVGRNNWLFCGSPRGGRNAAILYSLVESARRHRLDPFAYLRDLLTRIPTHPHKAIAELLPGRWKPLERWPSP